MKGKKQNKEYDDLIKIGLDNKNSIKLMNTKELRELKKRVATELEKIEKDLKKFFKNPPLYDIDEFIKEVPTLDFEFEK